MAATATTLVLGAALMAAIAADGGTQLTGERIRPDDHLPIVPEVIVDEVQDEKAKKDLLIAPIPVANPTIGNGLVLVAARMFRYDEEDTASPKSWFGVAAGYTDSESWAAGVAHRAHLNGDRWRLSVGGGLTELNYEYFGVGNDAGERGLSIPISQEGWVFNAEALRRIAGNWYAGLRYLYGDTESSVMLPDTAPVPPGFDLPDLALELDNATLGLHVQWDGRDSSFYPTSGGYFDLRGDFFRESLGSDREYERYGLSYNHFLPVSAEQVLALRVAGCRVTGAAPFWTLCQLGSGDDIRGYTGGRYRDTAMLTTQAEWRLSFTRRLGAVVFAGAGQVAPGLSEMSSGNVKPGGGIGLRINAATESKINVRVDYAWGEDDEGLYISVAEAF